MQSADSTTSNAANLDPTAPPPAASLLIEPARFFAASRAWLALLFFAGRAFAPGGFVSNPFGIWDAHWYFSIVEHGYVFDAGAGVQQNTAFFPLWPMCIRAFNFVLRDSAVSGALLANLFFFAALCLFNHWTAPFLSRRARRIALFLLAFFPTTVYFSMPYTESLFLICTVALFVFERRRAPSGPWLAAGAGLLAGLTHSNGWIAGAAVWLARETRESGESRWRPSRFAIGASGFIGVAIYMGYCWARFGDPLIPARSHEAWGLQEFRFFPAYFAAMAKLLREGTSAGFGIPIDGTWGLAMVGLAALLWKSERIPRAAKLYATLGALFPIVMMGGPGIRSMIRFSMINFPLWAGLALWLEHRKGATWVVGALWIALSSYLSVRFFRGLWVE